MALPSVYLASYLLVRWLGRPLPDVVNVPWPTAPLLFLVALVCAYGE